MLNKKKKVILGFISFILLTPVFLFYALNSQGTFDTRSRAGLETNCFTYNTKKECIVPRSIDIDANGNIDLTDYSLWVKDYLAYKKKSSSYNRRSDLNEDKKIDLLDFTKWVLAYKEFRTFGKNADKQLGKDGKKPNRETKYLGNKQWKYTITESLGGCIRDFNVSVDTTKSPNITITILKKKKTGNKCPADVFTKTKEGTFNAPQNAKVTYKETDYKIKTHEEPKREAKYLGNNQWKYTITESLGDCIRDFNVSVDTTKSPNITITILKKKKTGNICPTDVFTKTKEGTFNAPQNAKITYNETLDKEEKRPSRTAKYLGNNTWRYTITESLGGCIRDFNVSVDTTKSPNITIIIAKNKSTSGICPQDSFIKTKEGTFNAPQNAKVTYKETDIKIKTHEEPKREAKYLGNNQWKYTITESLGDCIRDFNVSVDTTKSPNITITILKKKKTGNICPADVFTKTKEGTFNAPQNAQISYIAHHE